MEAGYIKIQIWHREDAHSAFYHPGRKNAALHTAAPVVKAPDGGTTIKSTANTFLKYNPAEIGQSREVQICVFPRGR